MIARVIFVIFNTFRVISCASFDFNFVWFENNSTFPHNYLARQDLPESIENATKIALNYRIPVLLRRFDLSFARNLHILKMEHCEISDIEAGSFNNVPPLMNLSLSGNNLRHIKDGIFNSVEVKVLDLSHNKLSTIKPSAFDSMPHLTDLILDYNELTSYSLWFQECPKLVSISVQYNFIQYLPEEIFKHLAGQNFSVYFSFNKISKIHEDLFQVREFKNLYLDHNELVEFDHVLNKIDTLNLNVNHIECLSKGFMQRELNKVKRVLIFENPLNCSCYADLVKLKNVLVNRSENC